MAGNIFLKLDDIPGSATNKGYEGQIVCESLSFGGGVAVSGATGNMADRTAGKASIADISISKSLDAATHALFKAMVQGKVIPKGVITFVAATNAEAEKYLEISIENVIISSLSFGSSGETPSESVSLNFTKVLYSHQLRDEAGKPQPKRVEFDLKTNVVS